MKKFVTSDVSNNVFVGGLPIVWDDLLYVQNAINTAMSQVNKAIGNNESVYIISGCTTRRWVGYINTEDFEISAGVLSINGEPMIFNGFEANIYPSTKAWFTVSRDNIGGSKVIKATNDVVQCYTENRLIFNHGVEYPAGVAGVDYFPITKNINTNSPAVYTMYEILQENLQKKTAVVTGIVPIGSGVQTQALQLVTNGNVCQLNGVIRFTVHDGLSAGFELCTVPKYPHTTLGYYFRPIGYILGVGENKYVPLKFIGNKLVLADSLDVAEGTEISIGISYISN